MEIRGHGFIKNSDGGGEGWIVQKVTKVIGGAEGQTRRGPKVVGGGGGSQPKSDHKLRGEGR